MNKVQNTGNYIYHGTEIRNGETIALKEGDIVVSAEFGALKWLEYVAVIDKEK